MAKTRISRLVLVIGLGDKNQRRPVPIVAGAVLYKNEILLIKRLKPPYTGMWAFVGGKIEAREAIENAMLREAKEETGLGCRFMGLNVIVHEHLLGDKQADYVMFFCSLEAPSLDVTRVNLHGLSLIAFLIT